MAKTVKISPRRQARKDIREYLDSLEPLGFNQGPRDSWYVTGEDLLDKEVTVLNRQLGMHSINMNALNMNRK